MKHVKQYELFGNLFGGKKKLPEPKKGDEIAEIIVNKVKEENLKIKDDGYNDYSVEIDNEKYTFGLNSPHSDKGQRDAYVKIDFKKIEITEDFHDTIKEMYLDQKNKEENDILTRHLDKLADYRKDAKKYNM